MKTKALICILSLGFLQSLSACGRFSSVKTNPLTVPQDPAANNTDLSHETESDSIFDSEIEDSYDNLYPDSNGRINSNLYSQIRDFTPSSSVKDQAQGSYSFGSLVFPSNLLVRQLSYGNAGEAAPFRILYPDRKNFYGTSDTIEMIDYLAQYTKTLIPEFRLMLGDISKQHGGKLGSHASHQIGMDADIGYLVRPPRRTDRFSSVVETENLGTAIYLSEQLRLLHFAVQTGKIDRIFIHPKIKAALCRTASDLGALKPGKEVSSLTETFRRLIPEVNHYNHLHLRLKCSSIQPNCRPMDEPAQSTGCK